MMTIFIIIFTICYFHHITSECPHFVIWHVCFSMLKFKCTVFHILSFWNVWGYDRKCVWCTTAIMCFASNDKINMSNQSKSNKPCVQPRWLFASIELNISFQELDIQNMDLERIELGAFCGIWEIVTLNLENNKLTTLPELCSLKCCLVNLYVGKNDISQLTKHFWRIFKNCKESI